MTWEVRDGHDTLSTRAEVLPVVSSTRMDQTSEQQHQLQQQHHRWDIRDRILPQVHGGDQCKRCDQSTKLINVEPIEAGNLDPYDHWPNGSCRRAYDALRSAEASHHASGWAMRNTNNHNAAILKKSCLGILVCARRCVDAKRKLAGPEVRMRPAICDKARRKQIGQLADKPSRGQPTRGHHAYSVGVRELNLQYASWLSATWFVRELTNKLLSLRRHFVRHTGAQCPTAGCTGTLELRRCRGHSGYPVTHFWRTRGDTIFFQAKGFHDHPVPECWKTPLNKDRRSMKPKRKCRKRRTMTSFVHTSDDADTEEAEPLDKQVKLEPPSTGSPAVHLKPSEECIPAPYRHDLITSSTQWAEFSAWSRATNERISVVNNNDDQQVYDTGSSPWQPPLWQRVSKPDTLPSSPAIETPINFVSDCFRLTALQHPPTSYYPVCGESTGCCDDRSAGCRRRLFHFSAVDEVFQPYSNDGISFAPMRQHASSEHQLMMFPSPPPSTSTESFTASPPETRFGDDDFLQHLRACADSDEALVDGGAHPVRYSEMNNVDSSCFGQQRRTASAMKSELYDRHATWSGDFVDYPMTMENFVTNNDVINDDIDDVLSVMADIVMGGSSLMPNYVF